MRSRRKLFIATAFIEVGAGVALMSVPALVIWLVLAVRGPSPEALVIGRVGGAALLAIGLECWLARDDRDTLAQRALLFGAFVYNLGACAVFAYARVMLSMAGVALWPAIVLHALMTIWCAGNLRSEPTQG